MTDPNKIAKRDNKILTKEKLFRGGRIWFIILGIICIGIPTAVTLLTGVSDGELLTGLSVLFWLNLALAWNCHIRLQHIQTIKLGRYCPTCEYDLRGNPDATHCPECGHLAKPDPTPIT